MAITFIAWLALVAFLLWVNSLGRAMRDWLDADEGDASHGPNAPFFGRR